MHLASGAFFLIASLAGERAARLWFRVFGIVYAALAVMGFLVGDGMIFGLIANNHYDSWGHAGLALAMLLIGFVLPKPIAALSSTGTVRESEREGAGR
jgi:hypothetical protein